MIPPTGRTASATRKTLFGSKDWVQVLLDLVAVGTSCQCRTVLRTPHIGSCYGLIEARRGGVFYAPPMCRICSVSQGAATTTGRRDRHRQGATKNPPLTEKIRDIHQRGRQTREGRAVRRAMPLPKWFVSTLEEQPLSGGCGFPLGRPPGWRSSTTVNVSALAGEFQIWSIGAPRWSISAPRSRNRE